MQYFSKKIVLCGFFLASLNATAQLTSGIIVKSTGDTITCLIKQKAWEVNPKSIAYKLNEKGKTQTLTADEISVCLVGGYYFKSASVQIDKSEFKENSNFLSSNPAPEFVKEKVLLQYLHKAEQSLLYLKEDGGKIHFFIESDSLGIETLVHKLYTVQTKDPASPTGTKMMIGENQEYKQQLKKHFDDQYADKIDKLTYKSDPLVALFRLIYGASAKIAIDYKPQDVQQSQGEYKIDPPKDHRVEFGLIFGCTSSGLKFSGGDDRLYYQALNRAEFDRSLKPTFGASLDLFSRSGIALSPALMFHSLEFSGRDEISNKEFNFSFSYLALQLQLQYKFSRSTKGFYVLGGGTFAGALDVEVTDSFDYTESEFGVILGAGYHFKIFQIEAKAELTEGFSGYTFVNSAVDRYYLLVRIPLRK